MISTKFSLQSRIFPVVCRR